MIILLIACKPLQNCGKVMWQKFGKIRIGKVSVIIESMFTQSKHTIDSRFPDINRF